MPPPFNIIPTPKSVWYIGQWVYRKLCGHSRAAKKEHMRTIRVSGFQIFAKWNSVPIARSAECCFVTEFSDRERVHERERSLFRTKCKTVAAHEGDTDWKSY